MRVTQSRNVIALATVSLMALAVVPAQLSPDDGSAPEDTLRRRTIEADELELNRPTGVLVDPVSDAVYAVDEGGESSGAITASGPDDDPLELAGMDDPLNSAIDLTGENVITLGPSGLVAVPLDGGPVVVLHPDPGAGDPRGLTVDRSSGDIFILDNAGPRIIRVAEDGSLGTIELEIADVDLTGIARNGRDGLFYVGAPALGLVYAFDGDGSLRRTFDLSDTGVTTGRGIAFAPSTDPTDDPDAQTLVIADAGTDESAGQLVEVSLDPPARPASFSSHTTASLVAIRDLSALTPPSPDSAGVAYIEHRDNLLVSDSEVNEEGWYVGVNLYEMSLSAVITSHLGTTIGWSNEPTGVSYNPSNQHLYVSSDSGGGVLFDVDPGGDGTYGTGDDTVESTDAGQGTGDAEGTTYDPVSGHMFVVDGVGSEILRISPGADGLFDGSGDSLVGTIDVGAFGAGDPEGISKNPFADTLLVVDDSSTTVYEVTKTGVLVRAIDVSAAPTTKLAGIVLAPASAGGGWNMYLVDRGIDNSQDSNENDGMMFEMSLDFGPSSQVPPVASDDSATTPQGTPVTIDVAFNDIDGNGNLDPDTAATDSGPDHGSTTDNGDGTITYDPPNPTFHGIDTFTYEICDTDGLCDTAEVTVNVNNPPTANAGPDQTVSDIDGGGDEPVTLDGTGSTDGDGTIDTYQWFDGSDEIATGPNPTIDLNLGSYTIDLVVTDDDGATATDQVLVDVVDILGPTAVAGPDQTVGDTDNTGSETIDLDGSGSTPGDAAITGYEWKNGAATISTDADPAPMSFAVGVHTVTLTVTDANGLTDTDTVIITVNPAAGPTAAAGADQTVGDSDNDGSETIDLNGSLSTPGDAAITGYEWKNGAATISTDADPAPMSFAVGVHTVTLTVTDANGLTDTDTVIITVNPPAGPNADAGPDQGKLDDDGNGSENVDLDGSGSTPGDAAITGYEWKDSGGSSLSSEIDPTLNLPVGVHTLELTVTDANGLTGTDEVVIAISEITPRFYVSFTSSTSVPGISGTVGDTDVVAYDTIAGAWEMFFDSSDVGTSSGDLNAVHVRANGDVLMSWSKTISVPGLTGGPSGDSVDENDIFVFRPTSTGDVTAGTFSFLFDGSDVGLDTSSEDIDGIFEFPNGDLAISTTGSPGVVGGGDDSDVLLFTGTTGAATSGTWSMYFDGSDLGYTTGSEDVNAVSFIGPDMLYSTFGANSNPGTEDEDINRFTGSFGPTTAGVATFEHDLSALGIPGSANTDAHHAGSGAAGPGGDPPIANDDYDTTPAGTPVIIDVAANDTDVDGDLDDTTAKATSTPASGTTSDGGDGTITYTPDITASGLDSFDYEICDTTGLCDTATVTIDVDPNLPPIPEAGPDQTVTDTDGGGDEPVNLTSAGSTDPDGTITSYAWYDGAALISTDPNPTVTLAVGPHTITLTVTDNDGASASDTVSIDVNGPPVANAGPDQTVTDITASGDESVTLDGTGSTDPDGTITSWSWKEGITEIATGANPTLPLTVGTHTIELTVTDNDGLTDTDTVVITVVANALPIPEAGPDQTVTDTDGGGDEPVNLTSAGSTDPDGTITSYAWYDGAALISTDPNPTVTLAVGPHTITLTVTDNDGASASDTVSIDVNGPPVANAGPDQTVSDSDNSGSADVTLDGTGSTDPDGTITSWSWKEGVTEIATGANPTLPLTVGTHTIELTVTDNDGLTDTDIVVIDVVTNQLPIADAGLDQDVTDIDNNGNESVSLNGSGSSDPDGTITSWSWKEGVTEIATGSNPTVVLALGVHTIELTVTDNNGATATDTVVIDVKAPPVADAGPDQTVTDADDGGTEDVTLVGTGSTDADGSITSWSWKQGVTEIATGSNPTVSLAVGTHTIELTVTDNDGLTDTDTVVITVDPASQPVYVSLSSSQTLPGIAGTIGDTDIIVLDTLTGTWQMFYDSSDVGVTSGDLNAFHVRANGDVLMSYSGTLSVPGLTGGPSGTTVTENDVFIFHPTSTGDVTAGTFSFYFDGSDVGLSGTGGDIDGLFELPDGSLGISTVSGSGGADDSDIRTFTGTFGAATTGTWSMYFDGSDIGLTAGGDDVNAASTVGPTELMYSTTDTNNTPGSPDEDVNRFTGTFGPTTSGTATVELDMSTFGIVTSNDIDGLHHGPGGAGVPLGDPPTPVDDTGLVTAEDTPLIINVAANDSDPDGNLDITTARATTTPANGTTTDNNDGTITYTPDQHANGPDTFDYEICDTTSLCSTATVSLSVTPTPDPPDAVDDTGISTPFDTPVIINVAANDSDPDGDLDITTARATSAPAKGTTTDNNDGTITYEPNLGTSGPDTFLYEICDATASCSTATVSLTVGSVDLALDAVSSGSGTGSETVVSHTTSGADRLMLVGVSINNDAFETVSSVTYGGAPLFLVGAHEQSDDARVEIWALVAPAEGTADVVVTYSAPLLQQAVVGVSTFTGVDQVTPLGPFAGTDATSPAASVTAPSAADDLVLVVASCETCGSITFDPPAVEHWNVIEGGGKQIGAGSISDGASPDVTVQATLGASDHWVLGAVSVKPGSP